MLIVCLGQKRTWGIPTKQPKKLELKLLEKMNKFIFTAPFKNFI